MTSIDGLFGKIVKLTDEDDVVWEVGKDKVKEIEIGKFEDGRYNEGYARITMRNGEFKNVYGFMKSVEVEFN